MTSSPELADKQYALFKVDPRHRSLRFKRVGRFFRFDWRAYRALATEVDDGLLWFWIGSHADCDDII